MSEWRARRFWKQAEAVATEDGFAVHLDGRPLRSPSKALLCLPTMELARMVAVEWDAQHETINPEEMPVTRLANSAQDKVATQFDAVAALIAEYGGSDLVCYRAQGPETLIARQAEAWDPLIDWLCASHEVVLAKGHGLMPIEQSPQALQRIDALTRQMSPFSLTGFHEMVSLTGSWAIGFAVAHGFMTPDTGWGCSRIDEDWQIEQWGHDEEADEQAAIKRIAFFTACDFFAKS